MSESGKNGIRSYVKINLGIAMLLVVGLTFMYAIINSIFRYSIIDLLYQVYGYVPESVIWQRLTPVLISMSLLLILLFSFMMFLIARIGKTLEDKSDQEERFRLIYDNIPMAISLLNKDNSYFHCNAETMRIFGAKTAEECHRRIRNLTPEFQPDGKSSDDRRKEIYSEVYTKGYVRYEWMMNLPNGEPFPCEITTVRVKLQSGLHALTFVRDLRDYYKEKEREREIYDRTQTMVNAAPILIQYWHDNYYPMDCNQASMDFHGFTTKEEYVEGLIARVNAPEHIFDPWIMFLDEVKERGRSHITLDFLIDSRTGVPAILEIVGVRVEYSGKSILVTYATNVTELKKAQKDMQEAIVNSRAKSSFIANISHEIRTPMNSIIGFSELALDSDMPLQVQSYLQKILENADQLLQIINDVLDMSKIESGKVELENKSFNLEEIIDSCKTAVFPRASEKSLTLHFYAEPINKLLVGDSVRLRQILINIISNAIKFTDVGIIRVVAEVKNVTDSSVSLYFEVRDSGIGMSSGQVERIFDPFVQADSSITRKYGGTGLGLAITKNLLDLMGGELKIDSTPGIGTIVSFGLTFKTSTKAIKSSPPEINNFFKGEKPTFKGEVLVCEDNKMNQMVITENLMRVGLSPMLAENGQIAVDMVKDRLRKSIPQFDLILMDIHMPVMDGFEAVKKIREIIKDIPIVAMTANVLSEDRERYIESGMVDCVGKPFTSKELWAVLLKHLKSIESPEKN